MPPLRANVACMGEGKMHGVSFLPSLTYKLPKEVIQDISRPMDGTRVYLDARQRGSEEQSTLYSLPLLLQRRLSENLPTSAI